MTRRRLLRTDRRHGVRAHTTTAATFATVINALARWGYRRLTTPAHDDTVEPRWFVTSLAATVDASSLGDGAAFQLRLDGETFTLEVHADRVTARHGPHDHPTATVTGTLRDFFAASKGSRRAARRLTIDGDRAAGSRLLGDVTGADAPTALLASCRAQAEAQPPRRQLES